MIPGSFASAGAAAPLRSQHISSSYDANRSSGRFAISFRRIALSSAGRSGRRSRTSGGGFLACLVSLSVMSPPGKRRNSGQQIVERAAQRIHVALDAGRPAVSRLLGRHVVHGADRRPLPRDSLILKLVLERQAQVDDLDLPARASAGCSTA